MNKKYLVIASCIAAATTSALALGGARVSSVNSVVSLVAASSSTPAVTSQPSSLPPPSTVLPPKLGDLSVPISDRERQTAQAVQQDDVPPEVIYGILFREISAFEKKAKKREEDGEAANFLRKHHKEKFKLKDKEAKDLKQIALKTDAEVEAVDVQAKVVIAEVRARNPEGVIRPGEHVPSPPLRLRRLQEQRDGIVIAGREQLRSKMGDAAFQRFDEDVRQEIKRKMKPVVNIPRRNSAVPRPDEFDQ